MTTRFRIRQLLGLSPSHVRTVDVGDKAALSPEVAPSILATSGEHAREACVVCGVPVGHCFADLDGIAGGFCGGHDPAAAWLVVSFTAPGKPGSFRADGFRAVELAAWMRRTGGVSFGPWAILGPRALPPAPHDAVEVVPDHLVEVLT